MEKIICHQQYAGFEDLRKRFGAKDDVPDLKDVADPVGARFDRAPAAAAIKSAGGRSVQFDWALPPASEVDDEASSPFWKAPRVITYSPQKSNRGDALFSKLTAQLQEFFGEHNEDLLNEAIQICADARADAKAEAMRMAAE